MESDQDTWLTQFATGAGTDFQSTESKNFYVLTPRRYPPIKAQLLCKTAERILGELIRILDGIVIIKEGLSRKRIIILFATYEAYRTYVTSQYPGIDADAISTSGVLVQVAEKPPHLVIPSQDTAVTEGVLTHELARLLLSNLTLPIWIEEGIACLAEYETTGFPSLPIDEDVLARLREFWTSEKVQKFWDGSSFYQLDETSTVSRTTAELLIYALLKIYKIETFRSFVRNARYDDAGQQSAIQNLGVRLGDFFATALGIEQ